MAQESGNVWDNFWCVCGEVGKLMLALAVIWLFLFLMADGSRSDPHLEEWEDQTRG